MGCFSRRISGSTPILAPVSDVRSITHRTAGSRGARTTEGRAGETGASVYLHPAAGTSWAFTSVTASPYQETRGKAYRTTIGNTDSSLDIAAAGIFRGGIYRSHVSSRALVGRTEGRSDAGTTSTIWDRPSATVFGFSRSPARRTRGRSAARRTIYADPSIGGARSTGGVCNSRGPRANPSTAGIGSAASPLFASDLSPGGSEAPRFSRGHVNV